MRTLINLNFGPVCTNALNGLLNQYPRSLCNSTIPCQCGDILTQSRTLNSSDFNKGACSGDGLEIGAAGITLNCNGTSITWSGVSGSTGIKNILNNVTIKNCNVKDFNVGIHINGVSNNIINNNTVSSTTFSGSDGIWVETSTWNNVTNNNVSSYKWGIGLDTQSDNNVVEANTIYSCQRLDPSGNWIGYGINVYDSSVSIIKNNNVTNNSYGIYLYGNSNFNNISDNEILNNINAGITLSDCDPYLWCPGGNTNNTLQGNEISNNNYGIYSQNSNSTINSNTVCNNTLLDFNSLNWLSSSGDDNACGKPGGWFDTGAVGGCTRTCPTGVATSTNAGTAYFYTRNGTIPEPNRKTQHDLHLRLL
jgi:parallel beta-helix repeat protein